MTFHQLMDRFKGPAGIAAAIFGAAGLAVAKYSQSLSGWWQSYDQGLSTTFLGIAVTVLVIQVLLDWQDANLADTLRRKRESSIAMLLSRMMTGLSTWIPDSGAPASAHIPQLEWTQRQVWRIRDLTEVLETDIHDVTYREKLQELSGAADASGESIALLVHSIRSLCPDFERASALQSLQAKIGNLKVASHNLVAEINSHRGADEVDMGLLPRESRRRQ